MNVREGIRRVFVILGIAVAAAAMTSTSKVFPTERDHLEFWSEAVKRGLEEEAGSLIQWPAEASGEEFIRNFCDNSPTRSILQPCDGFKSDNSSLRRRQWEAAGGIAVAGVGAFALVYLLWRLLDWVIAGFQRPAVRKQQ